MLFVNHQDVLSVTPAFMVLNDVFSPDECKEIVEFGKKTNIEESKILGQDFNPNANDNIRQSKSSFIEPNEENAWIFDKLFSATAFINERYFHFDLHGFNSIQYTEYHQGGDFYDWHLDLPLKGLEMHSTNPAARLRKLSGSVILSDSFEYTGGELYIERKHNGDPVYSVEQRVGSIVFFPSFVVHKVDKVYSGIRRSLVFWVEGPKFK